MAESEERRRRKIWKRSLRFSREMEALVEGGPEERQSIKVFSFLAAIYYLSSGGKPDNIESRAKDVFKSYLEPEVFRRIRQTPFDLRGFLNNLISEPSFNPQNLYGKIREQDLDNLRVAYTAGGQVAPEIDECVAMGTFREWGYSGVLVTPRVVLGAAHGRESEYVLFGRLVNDSRREIRRIVKVESHPGRRKAVDLAIFVLESPAPSHVKPAVLLGNLGKPALLLIAGYGTNGIAGNGIPGVRRKASVPVTAIDASTIQTELNASYAAAEEEQDDGEVEKALVVLNGRMADSRGACPGDSGGPGYVTAFDWGCIPRRYLATVVSRPVPDGVSVCPAPTLHVRLDVFIKWIQDTLRQLEAKHRDLGDLGSIAVRKACF